MSEKIIDEEVVDLVIDTTNKEVGLHYQINKVIKNRLKEAGYTIKKKQPEPKVGQVWIGFDRIVNIPIYLTNNEHSMEDGFGYIRLDELVDGRTGMNIEYLLDNYTFGYHSLDDYYREKFNE